VVGEPNAMLGQIIVAKVALSQPEPLENLKRRIRAACRTTLAPYKAPAKVLICEAAFHNSRQKKIRRA
jgi:acyl-coenzyme A synthetase/AMP-(fatty) acid ligase